MLEAPQLKAVVQIDQALSQPIQVPVLLGIVIHGKPCGSDLLRWHIGLSEIARQRRRRHPVAALRQQSQHLIVQTRCRQRPAQQLVFGLIAPVDLDNFRMLVAQDEFKLTILQRLKARGASQQIAKRGIVRRRHGGQHFPDRQQLCLHASDALEHLEGRTELIPAHALDNPVQFVQHQPHPQLRDLVHDDEQHLIVLAGQRLLCLEQAVEPQILAIGERAAEIPMHALIG